MQFDHWEDHPAEKDSLIKATRLRTIGQRQGLIETTQALQAEAKRTGLLQGIEATFELGREQAKLAFAKHTAKN